MNTTAILLKSKRFVSKVNRTYKQCGNMQELIYTLAQEQGFILDLAQVSAMINKRRRKKYHI